MNVTPTHRCPIRRSILAHSVLIALTLGLGASAFAAGGAIDSPTDHPSDLRIGDPASRRVAIDAVSLAWRTARGGHTASLPPVGSAAVSNCDDDGPGSLREAIANAASGDTIDLTATGCSQITLSTGALVVLQDRLTLQGPTDGVIIDAGDQSEVFVHLGDNYLTLDHLSIVHGSKYQSASSASDARGGCIASAGLVALQYSEVTNCAAVTLGPSNVARGGAIYATGGVVVSASLVGGAQAMSIIDSAGGAISTPAAVAVINSVVTQGIAQAQTGEAHGGGIDVGGEFFAQSASVLQNVAITQDYQGSGGGVRAQGVVDISSSSFAINGSMTGGAIELRGTGYSRSIANSTIAGNSAAGVAGVLAAGSDLTIRNSSIAYNRNVFSGIGSGLFAEGVNIELQSSLIAFNGDLDNGVYADVEGSGTLSGSNNLIHTAHVTPPVGTIEQVDPLIVPVILDDTHVIIELKPGSAAIDAGNNAFALDFDQRGTGYPRQIGVATDIGSYEFDLGDLVFADGFD